MALVAELPTTRNVEIPIADGSLHGFLALPTRPMGLVLFAHGSGSSRHSPRNQHVAEALRAAGLGTLLFDLLTEREEAIDKTTARLRFDIPLLARRLETATAWAAADGELAALPIGYFGASTGAAAALVAAAALPQVVRAVVSRGGRPDLAGQALAKVRAPTLLVVGALDREVLDLNRHAMAQMKGDAALSIVDGATHLFEEPGTLDEVCELATGWLRKHLTQKAEPSVL